MFEAFDALAEFLGGLTYWEWVMYFWPFFVIDFTRFTILDLVVMTGRSLRPTSTQNRKARGQLYHDHPLVSVLIPGKDEGPNLEPLIRSLHQQTYSNIEVILIDDGSEDQTPRIGRRLEATGRVDRFLRQEVRGGKASAANMGLQFAEGEFVVHVDADSYLRENAIEEILLPFYRDENVGAVSGDIRVANRWVSFPTILQTYEYLKSITLGRTVMSEINILGIVAGAFGAFRTQTLRRLGGWDVGPGLDGDLTLKIRKLGYSISHVPTAICYTNAPTSFFALAQQRYRWGRSLVRFRLRKHRDLLNPGSPFRVSDFLTVADNVFFNLIVNFKWWIYILQISLFNPLLWPFLFFVNIFLYSFQNISHMLFVKMFLGRNLRKRTSNLYIFSLIMPLYMGIYLRTIRTFAYIMEITFQASFWDPWNPWKVSRTAHREGT